ncbi:MAG TPA: sulfate adenylyltransferase subunit CysD [Bacteroidales bacterium]|jgi:sulfate adenylyltransferase subunit 2|nr:sulfate adenylyltransferase subunit CysD [Bacteroidales bacterium]
MRAGKEALLKQHARIICNNMHNYNINHLKELEAESVYVIREVAAQFDKPVMLFSGGKDSIVMYYLARKAFWPMKVPFPLLHIDTGHNFQETLDFRDELMEKTGGRCIVRFVQDSIDQGKAIEETGFNASRNVLQTVTLLDAISEFKFDAALGGGRRDEEKARAKERFFSHRDEFGQWDPKNQRPELWNQFNGRKRMGEHFRVFPLSNWTEMDVWQYIYMEQVEIPNLYYTHKREVFNRDGVWLAYAPFMKLKTNEKIVTIDVRCRTIGDITCTGLTLSKANTLEDIINEVAATRVTERGGRYDDKRSESAMEDRKKEGYF